VAHRRTPNVLWIQTDELRADALGCYGQSPWAQPLTPNLDALAAHGVLFSNTYCNCPVCVPSRTSMLTGRYPHEIGVYHNEASRNGHVLPGHLVSFPQAFAAAGYQTVTIGKTHTPKHPIWGRVVPALAGAGSSVRPYRARRGDAPPLAVRLPGAPPVLVAGIYTLAPGEISATRHLTNLALEWLEADAKSDDPWMLRVSYLMPHTPVLPPERFAEMFDPGDFAFDATRDRPHEAMSAFERLIAEANRGEQLSPDEVARARAHYWAVMAHVDDEIGRILSTLDELGLTRRTIVIFDSDHGAMLGEMGLWQKQMFDRAVHRVPQIIAWPGVLPQGQVRGDLNELLDRGPTLFGLCGIDRPSGFRGRDLFSGGPEPEAIFGVIGYGQPDSILYPLAKSGPVTPRRACVRTRPYRYDVSIRCKGRDITQDDPAREPCLIDVKADPQERNNLSGRPELGGVERRLAAMLEDWLALDAGITDPPLKP